MNITNLDKVSFFKPVIGKTLREQLQGKTLVGAEVVEYLRSLDKANGFVPPAHWEKPSHGRSIYCFSLTYLAPRYIGRSEYKQEPTINGFVWSVDGFDSHFRDFAGDPIDVMVGNDWHPNDWILIESE